MSRLADTHLSAPGPGPDFRDFFAADRRKEGAQCGPGWRARGLAVARQRARESQHGPHSRVVERHAAADGASRD